MATKRHDSTPFLRPPPRFQHLQIYTYPDAISEILIIVRDVLEVNFDGGAILFIDHLDDVFILARLVARAGRRAFLNVALLIPATATLCQCPPRVSLGVGLVLLCCRSGVRADVEMRKVYSVAVGGRAECCAAGVSAAAAVNVCSLQHGRAAHGARPCRGIRDNSTSTYPRRKLRNDCPTSSSSESCAAHKSA